jgi:hypothetical protein
MMLYLDDDSAEALLVSLLRQEGHYPGLFIVRRDNDARRDLKPAGIVRAIRNFLAASVPVRDQFTILNQWR